MTPYHCRSQRIQSPMLLLVTALATASASGGDAPQCPSGTSASGDGGTCVRETTDEVQMLQKRAAPSHLEAGSPDQSSSHSLHAHGAEPVGSIALALDGGGWTALSVQVGVLVGVLAGLGNAKGVASPTLESTGLLDNVGLISSVSGGSWFAAELLYSKRFLELVNTMAADPVQASEVFDKEWMQPYFKSIDGSSFASKLLAALAAFFDSTTLRQIASVIGITANALEQNGSWASVIEELLEITADIPKTLPLNSAQANSWAQGKVWLACNSLAVPSGQDKLWAFISRPLGQDYYEYNSTSEVATPLVPAKISWRIGDEASTPSPFPFVASTAVPPETTLLWSGTHRLLFPKSTWTSTTKPLGNFASLQSGALPLSHVAAASSAVLAGTALSPSGEIATAVAELALRLPVYAAVTPGANDNAFAAAEGIMEAVFAKDDTDESTTTSLGQTGVSALFDGAYTDNTGIGHAVAAGASSVTAIMQNGFGDFIPLFIEESTKPSTLFGPFTSAHFGIFTFPPAELGGTTAVDHIQKLIASFEPLDITGAPNVTGIQLGHVKVVTRANPWFGIEADRSVSLTLLNVDVTLAGIAAQGVPVVAVEDAALVGEIAENIARSISMPSNQAAVATLSQSVMKTP